MPRMMLARHGETVWNAQGRYQGASEIPLSERGRAQARALANHLASQGLDTIVASDLRRAWETALVIAAPYGLEVCPEPGLRELDFGAWEGLSHDQIRRCHAQALDAWQADPLGMVPPQGESLGQMASRVGEALHRLPQLGESQTILVVAHGGSLRLLICLALGLPPLAYERFHLAPGSLSELHLYPGGAVLTRLNDTCHLEETGDGG